MSIASWATVKSFCSVPIAVSKQTLSSSYSILQKCVGNKHVISVSGQVLGPAVGAYAINSAINLSKDYYNSRVEQHDMSIIGMMYEDDCGDVSKMPEKVRRCYKKYANEAILRYSQKANILLEDLRGRYLKCFKGVKISPCNGEKVVGWDE